ncbi:luc7-like protein 3, partial [Penaeus monodon]|uniref:luc7-like protein 3 n=1 Tax=Penaeus monodon TaxID=6687 RepID=UPI0018A7E239
RSEAREREREERRTERERARRESEREERERERRKRVEAVGGTLKKGKVRADFTTKLSKRWTSWTMAAGSSNSNRRRETSEATGKKGGGGEGARNQLKEKEKHASKRKEKERKQRGSPNANPKKGKPKSTVSSRRLRRCVSLPHRGPTSHQVLDPLLRGTPSRRRTDRETPGTSRILTETAESLRDEDEDQHVASPGGRDHRRLSNVASVNARRTQRSF